MSKDYKVYLLDILDAISKINSYTSGLDQEQFIADSKTIDAVVRNLEITGEAAKKLPETIRSQIKNVEWKKIAGLRDILIHQYSGIDNEIIWDILTSKLPPLEKSVKDYLQQNT